MLAVQTKSIVFFPGPDDDGALKLTAKCYTPERGDPHGLTLLCAHGAGTHKEQWEPTLEQVFLEANKQDSPRNIREAWSVDWQSHGDGATVNEAALKNRQGVFIEWAEAIAAFVQSTHLQGHRIVAIGHSAGASVVLLATQKFQPQNPPFAGLILVEPVMCSKAFYAQFGAERDSALETAITVVNARRTAWPSRAAAFAHMRRNFIWKGWDPRVLRTYVDHGMRDLPDKSGVVLSTRNDQEISAYVNVPPHLDAVDQYRRIAPYVPVHFIFGVRNDLVPPESQDSIFDPARGIHASSTQRVRRAGHMVLQENPDGLAAAILEALRKLDQRRSEVSSKL